jgi:hypothetical protein
LPPDWVGSCPTGKVVDGGRAILDRGVVLLDRHGAVVDANSLAMTRLLPGSAVRVKRATAAAYRVLVSPLPEPTDTRNAAFVALVYAPNTF